MKTIKNNKTLLPLATVVAVALTGSALAAPTLPLSPARKGLLPNHRVLERINPDILRPVPGKPDLAIKHVRVQRHTPRGHRTMARIFVTVKNVGRADWSSGANQQGLSAYVGSEHHSIPGNLTNLRAGQERTFELRIPSAWGKGVEFPPPLTILIAFDPDIFLDGNPANDDAVSGNNRKSFTGAQMNALIGR